MHVCAGGETAALRSHDAALLRYLADKSLGPPGRTAQDNELEAARAGIARLWGVSPGDIGFVSNVAEGVSIVADSLDWREGDSTAIDAHEYPSVVGPIAMRRDPAVALRQARGSAPDRLAGCIDASTRIIAASYVSYLTGERVDLTALRALADRVGALLLVDFTQASGYLPIEASVADFAFSACYKWMLGMTGVAIAYWNRARQPDWAPASAGWHSFAPSARDYDTIPALRADAMRFTRGNPAHGSIYVLNNALSFLSRFDMRDVQRHVQTLTVALLDRLAASQVPVMTSLRAGAARGQRMHCFIARTGNRGCTACAGRLRVEWAWPGSHQFPWLQFHGGRGSHSRGVDQPNSDLIAALFCPIAGTAPRSSVSPTRMTAGATISAAPPPGRATGVRRNAG